MPETPQVPEEQSAEGAPAPNGEQDGTVLAPAPEDAPASSPSETEVSNVQFTQADVTEGGPQEPVHEEQIDEAAVEPPVEQEAAAPPATVHELLAKVPRVTDAEYRIVCNDIAEEVAKSWSFLVRVLVAMAILAAAFIGVVGVTIHDMAKEERDAAKDKIDAEIASQFKDDRVKALVEKAADDKAQQLLKSDVQPSIDAFNQHLKDQSAAYDKEVSAVRDEVAALKARNEITALADKAIEDGDVASFHKLRDMAYSNPPHQGAEAEFFRVMSAYSIFAPVRWVGSSLVVSHIDPSKTKQEDLTPEQLLFVINKAPEPQARGIAADLLANNAKPGSYSTIKALMDDIQNEQNLEVIRREKRALSKAAPSFTDGGTVDAQDAIDWWKAHQADMQKADTDPKPTPAPPSPTPAPTPSGAK
jgi:hypothetical protein